MTTITGPFKDSQGTLITARVHFTPYPDQEAKVVASSLVTGEKVSVELVDGEPSSTLQLQTGTYTVFAPNTDPFRIAVPDGDGTSTVASLVTSGVTNPPTVDFGVPAGGTDGQVLTKQSAADGDADWETPSSGGGGGTPGDTVADGTSFGNASTAGVAAEYSRADHDHGTPAAPTAASVGADPAGTAAGLVGTHEARTDNPHAVTAAQAGADAAGTAAAAVASHEAGAGVHAIAATTGLQTALDAKAAASALTSHTSDTANPHAVTAAQVGADAAGTAAAAVASHAAGSGVHAIAATTGLQSALDAKATVSALISHTTDTANPHAVTAAQVGADASGTAASAVSAHAGGSGVHSIAGVTGLQSALDERTGSRLAILGEGARTLVSGSVWASTVQDNHVRQTVASSTACVVRISFGNYISPFGGGACGYNEFGLSTSFRAMLVVAFDGFVSSAAKAAIYIPGANTETAAVIGAKGIGIHVVGNAAGNQLMSVAVHNGTSLTESTPAEMAAGSSKSHNIALEWRAGVSATLYVNGVQWGQVTTGLPTGTIPSARFIAAVFDTGAGVGAYSTFGIRGILVESL